MPDRRRFVYRKVPHPFGRGTFLTRRSRDLNPGCGYPHYSLSRGAPSATWVLLHVKQVCSWRRERDSNPRCLATSLVFKTSAFNRSAISPHLEPAEIIIAWECVPVKQFFPGSFSLIEQSSESVRSHRANFLSPPPRDLRVADPVLRQGFTAGREQADQAAVRTPWPAEKKKKSHSASK